MAPGVSELLQQLFNEFPQVPQELVQQVVEKHWKNPLMCNKILNGMSGRSAFNPLLGGVMPTSASDSRYQPWQPRPNAPTFGSGSFVVRKNKAQQPPATDPPQVHGQGPIPAIQNRNTANARQLTVRVRSVDESEESSSSGTASPRRKNSLGSPGLRLTPSNERMRPDSPLAAGQRAQSRGVGDQTPSTSGSVSLHFPSGGITVTRQDSGGMRSSESVPSFDIVEGGHRVRLSQAVSSGIHISPSQPSFIMSPGRRSSGPPSAGTPLANARTFSPLRVNTDGSSSVFDTPSSENNEFPGTPPQIRISFGGGRPIAQDSRIPVVRPTVTFGPYANVQQATDTTYMESLTQHQLSRKSELEGLTLKTRERLEELRSDVETMENDLLHRRKHSMQSSSSVLTADTVQALHQETRRLQADVNTMNKEVQLYRDKTVASRGFDSTLTRDTRTLQPKAAQEKPKSPFEKLMKHLPGKTKGLEDPTKEDCWSCGACTFLNHPALSHCEICHLPRVRGTSDSDFPGTWRCYCCPDSASDVDGWVMVNENPLGFR